MKPLFETTWIDERGQSVTHTGTKAGTEKLLRRFAKSGVLANTVQIGVSPEKRAEFPSGVFAGADGKAYWALQIITSKPGRKGRGR